MCAESLLSKHGSCVCNSHDGHYSGIDETCQIWIARYLVYLTGYNSCYREYKHHGEEPKYIHRRIASGKGSLCPQQMLLCEVSSILKNQHYYCRSCGRCCHNSSVDPSFLSTRIIVIEAVERNGGCNIIYKEERQIREKSHKYFVCSKCLKCKSPEAEVRLEEVISKEHATGRNANDDYRQNNGLTQLCGGKLNSASREIKTFLFTLSVVVYKHTQY